MVNHCGCMFTAITPASTQNNPSPITNPGSVRAPTALALSTPNGATLSGSSMSRWDGMLGWRQRSLMWSGKLRLQHNRSVQQMAVLVYAECWGCECGSWGTMILKLRMREMGWTGREDRGSVCGGVGSGGDVQLAVKVWSGLVVLGVERRGMAARMDMMSVIWGDDDKWECYTGQPSSPFWQCLNSYSCISLPSILHADLAVCCPHHSNYKLLSFRANNTLKQAMCSVKRALHKSCMMFYFVDTVGHCWLFL